MRVPKESETIARKRATRLAEKIEAKKRFHFATAWWTNGWAEAVVLILIFVLNFLLVYPLFGTAAAPTSFSAPIIPALARILGIFTPFAFALQIIYLTFFLAFPLSFYWLIKKISGRKLVATLSVLFASLPIYPFALARLQAGLGVDGPHIASLALIPLGLYSLFAFWQRGEAKNLLFAALTSSAIALTSPFGFLTFVGLAAIAAFSEMLLGRGRLKLLRFVVIILVTLGLVSFWYNPQFAISLFFGSVGEEIRRTVEKLIPISLFIIPVLATLGFLLFERRPAFQPLFLAGFWTTVFLLIVLLGGEFIPSHPSRYVPELGLSFAFLLGILTVALVDFVKRSPRLGKAGNLILAGVFGLIILLFIAYFLSERSLTASSLVGEGVAKGELWLARESSSSLALILGYLMTGITLGAVSFIWAKAR